MKTKAKANLVRCECGDAYGDPCGPRRDGDPFPASEAVIAHVVPESDRASALAAGGDHRGWATRRLVLHPDCVAYLLELEGEAEWMFVESK
jgi:acetone carboxylase gamma subunit